MKWIVRLLIGLVALVVVVFGAAAIFLATIDPNDYKDLIAKQVNAATGRALTIQGDIGLSFFPWLGLAVGQTALSNAPGFGDEPFARVDAVEVRVALLPLFRREVQADTVSLKGLRLNLSRNPAGLTNWQDLLKQAEPEQTGKPQEPGTGKPSAALAVAVGGIDIEDAALTWQDALTGNRLAVSPFALQTGAIKPGEPFALTMDVALENQQPPLKMTAVLSGEVTADPGEQRYRLDGMRIEVDAEGDALPGGRLQGTLKTTAVADLQAQTLSVPVLTAEIMELVLKGQLDVTQLQARPEMKGALQAEPFSPRPLLERLDLAQHAPADPAVMQQAALEVNFQGNPEAIAIGNLRLVLDDSTLTGTANVNSGSRPGSRPQIRFSLALDRMDADRYLPPSPAAPEHPSGEPAGEPAAAPRSASLQLPVQALRELDLAGDVKAGQLKVANVQLADLLAEVSAKGGMIGLKPLRTALYGGGLESGLSVDVRGDVPKFAAVVDLKAVQMGPLMAALQEGKGYLDGTGMFSANLQTRGERVADLKSSLDGKLSLSVADGALYDKQLAAKVEAAVAFLEGRPPKPTSEAIIFESLNGSAEINDGLLRNRDLQFITSLILAKGEGTANLAEDSLDYTLSLALAGGAEDKKRVFVPVTVKGPYAKLKYGVNLEKVAKERLRDEAEKRIGKELEKVVPKDLGEPLKEGLKGFLGR